jgi:dTDP-4-amino-4,6-dideoxygalactose transaminase
MTIPYGRQIVDDDDVRAVCDVLRSDWLTTGPAVGKFESAVSEFVGAHHAVAVSSGTAALHAAMTFAATSNAVLYCGGRPVFADVEPGTLTIDPASVERALGPKTRAIVGVDYAGQPCDWDALSAIAKKRDLVLIDDACHALGAEYKGRKVGTLADMTILSFHPVKHVTTGEGGMVLAQDAALADRARRFRNHGIDTDQRQRAERGTFHYEMVELGYNYRLSDIACALGVSQLMKLPRWLDRRNAIARAYDEALSQSPFAPLAKRDDVRHAYHLYVVRTGVRRDGLFRRLRAEGIGVNVHYMPVYLHDYYRRTFGTARGLCPVAEAAYDEVLSLPMYAGMTDEDVSTVIGRLARLASEEQAA